MEPTFLLTNGLSIFPGPGFGPVTTWIYGPVTPIIFLPATLATSAASALMVAGGINLVITVGAVAAVCAFWPSVPGQRVGSSHRLAAGLLCIALWPASSFHYIQADNAAVALGLLANLLLIRSGANQSLLRWFAAFAAVAAIASKQTALGPIVAQIIWLFWREGSRAAAQQVVRATACGLIIALATFAYFDPAGLQLNMIDIPARIPWTNEGLIRLRDLAPLLALHLGVPLIYILMARRTVWHPDSPLLLPILTWIAATPFGLASLFKLGGTLNSLQSLLFFLPPFLVGVVAEKRSPLPFATVGALVALGICLLRLHLAPSVALQPRIKQLREAETLVAQWPDQIWFPWNPLVTYYSEHRFDHVEDGLYVRFLAGQPLTFDQARSYLPPDWHAMAMLTGSSDWGVASHLCPENAVVRQDGFWSLTIWPLAK